MPNLGILDRIEEEFLNVSGHMEFDHLCQSNVFPFRASPQRGVAKDQYEQYLQCGALGQPQSFLGSSPGRAVG